MHTNYVRRFPLTHAATPATAAHLALTAGYLDPMTWTTPPFYSKRMNRPHLLWWCQVVRIDEVRVLMGQCGTV